VSHNNSECSELAPGCGVPQNPTRMRKESGIHAAEWAMAIFALLTVPLLVIEDRASDPSVRQAAHILNWIVWLTFCVEFIVRWILRKSLSFVREAWFDLLLIVISPPFLVPDYWQGLRSIRVVRFFRLLRLIRVGAITGLALRLSRRLFGRRKFHYTAIVALAVVFMGALGVFIFESDSNRAIGSFGDALWWAVVTATTVGYGDVSPVTLEGRLIAVVLMLTGIGVIGVFTATVATAFFEEDKESELTAISARLESIEGKLNELISRDRSASASPQADTDAV
jgi:voltage-gated potassium channel